MIIQPINRSATSLAEVTIALAVASICLVTILGLLPIGLRTNQEASQRLLAEQIIGAVIADLRAARVIGQNAPITSKQFAITIPTFPHSDILDSTLFFAGTGEFSTSPTTKSKFRLTIRFLPNIELNRVAQLQLEGTWPAEAAPENAVSRSDMFVALDLN